MKYFTDEDENGSREPDRLFRLDLKSFQWFKFAT